MAVINLNIPDAAMQRILDGLVPNDPAPLTQGQAAKAKIIELIKAEVKKTEDQNVAINVDIT